MSWRKTTNCWGKTICWGTKSWRNRICRLWWRRINSSKISRREVFRIIRPPRIWKTSSLLRRCIWKEVRIRATWEPAEWVISLTGCRWPIALTLGWEGCKGASTGKTIYRRRSRSSGMGWCLGIWNLLFKSSPLLVWEPETTHLGNECSRHQHHTLNCSSTIQHRIYINTKTKDWIAPITWAKVSKATTSLRSEISKVAYKEAAPRECLIATSTIMKHWTIR